MPDEAVIEKIKKLLRLSKSNNPHEAELAMQRAMEIAAKHQIDLSGVDPSDDKNRVTHDFTPIWTRLPIEARYAEIIIRRFFSVDAMESKGGRFYRSAVIIIVGHKSEIEIALYVFNFLVGHFRRSWNNRANKRLRNRKAFMRGLFEGLFSKLHEAEQKMHVNSDGSLVTTFQHYIAAHFGKTETGTVGRPDHDAIAAESAGFDAGRNTNIRPAVHHHETDEGRLLK